MFALLLDLSKLARHGLELLSDVFEVFLEFLVGELAFGAGLFEELIEFPELEVQVGRVLLLGLQLQVELEDVLGDLLFFSEGEVVI